MTKRAFSRTPLDRVPETGDEVTVYWRIPRLGDDGRHIRDKYGLYEYDYHDGEIIVTERHFYADNSIVIFGNLHSTGERTQVEIKPPSGDACF